MSVLSAARPWPPRTEEAPPRRSARRQTQPARRQTHSARRQTRPARRQTQPARRQTRPARRQTQSARRQTQPARRQTRPARRQTRPANAHGERMGVGSFRTASKATARFASISGVAVGSLIWLRRRTYRHQRQHMRAPRLQPFRQWRSSFRLPSTLNSTSASSVFMPRVSADSPEISCLRIEGGNSSIVRSHPQHSRPTKNRPDLSIRPVVILMLGG